MFFKKLTNNILFFIFVITVGVTLTNLVSQRIPIEMDEYIQYLTLGCTYFNNMPKGYQIDNDFCNVFQLSILRNIFGNSPYLPLRSWSYVGSIQNLFYLPICFFWKSIFSVRLLGFITIGIQAIFIQKIFKFNKYISFLFLLIFLQYSAQHIFDLGQLSFLCTAIFIIYYLILKIFRTCSSKKIYHYSVILGLICFLCIAIRLNATFFFPSIFILILYFFIKEFFNSAIKYKFYFHMKKLILGLTFAFFSFLIPTILLLTAIDKKGNYYYNVIISNTPKGAFFNIKDAFTHFNHSLLKYLLNPTETISPEILVPNENLDILLTILNWLPLIMLICFFMFSRKICFKYKIHVFLLLIVSFLSLYTASASPRSWNMHHLVFAYPFLILSILYILKIKSKVHLTVTYLFLILFFLSQSCIIYQFMQKPPRRLIDKNLPNLINVLNKYFGKNSIIIHSEWGSCFVNYTHGNKNQIVSYYEGYPYDNLIRQYLTLAQNTNRNILIVGNNMGNRTKAYLDYFKHFNYTSIKFKDPEKLLGDYTINYIKINL